jgi:fatty acid kinase fatty acid binding subunit
MPKISVIADTDASLSPEFAKKQGITLVPILINFGSESFASGVDIDDRALFERIDKEGALPKTAAPSPGAFTMAFKKEFDSGAEGIVCVCVSSEISATYTSALTAREEFPGKEIRVIDSRSVSMAQGFMALEAKKMAEAGASLNEIESKVKGMQDRFVLFASLSTLKYLAMGGRVGKFSASMGNMLSIRPILTMKYGKLDLLEKVRTRKAAMSRLVELLAGSVDSRKVELAAFIHVAAEEELASLEQELRARITLPAEVVHTGFSPGLSVHTGAGTIGAVLLLGE